MQRVPILADYIAPEGEPDLGVRVVPARILHGRLASQSLRSPKLRDLVNLDAIPTHGWRLEAFICEELLECREGDRFESIDDRRIRAAFFRRTGAIAAAIAITVEAPTVAT